MKKIFICLIGIIVLSASVSAVGTQGAASSEPDYIGTEVTDSSLWEADLTDLIVDDTLYTTTDTSGVSIAVADYMAPSLLQLINDLRNLGLEIDVEEFLREFCSVVRGEEPWMSQIEADALLQQVVMERQMQGYQMVDTVSSVAEAAFIQSVAELDSATMLPSGVVVVTLTEGSGAQPTIEDEVRITYELRLSDGVTIDLAAEPTLFSLLRVTPGFAEGMQQCRAGGQYRIVIPAVLGYGSDGIPGVVPGNAALDFTVDLIEVIQHTDN